ncbi:hypothetical protein HNQ91_004303 [Filimonas zeae]|uniref:YD repeat-containing protein n=1 Tax=Filimonas zeae TaxID=1737353 RepID=A0A917J1K9_9BACT|nr:hypothetical protein [Filimonas zeae]MDR6341230.1 hypothetical protein [Filimonas zeae]GGH76707.1 hypothetical protein GCM10011379_41950 [Filimonas zeae]
MKNFRSGSILRLPTLLFIVITVMIAFSSYGQDTASNRGAAIIPPSPNSAAIEKFGVTPVNYSTGIPEINYPMWNWSRGKLSLSLGLSYHAGGNKVQDLPGNVGLGWALSTSYRVSRTLRGLNDDLINYGYMHSPVLPTVVTTQYDNGYYNILHYIGWQEAFYSSIGITPRNSPYSDLVREVGMGKMDGEQDVFSFSYPGGSGKFVIDKGKKIVPLEYTNSKLTMSLNSAGAIASFNITDDKGVIYQYMNLEIQHFETVSTSQAVPETYQGDYASAWLLTYIIDPQVKDTIEFKYASALPPNAFYETGFRETRTLHLTSSTSSGAHTPNYVEQAVGSYDRVELNEPQLAEIRLPDGSKVNLEYGFNRTDLVNAKALTLLTVTNMNNDVVKKYRMAYSYFTSSGVSPFIPYESGNDYSKRLRLDSVSELAISGPLAKVTKFTYEGTALNPRNSTNVDHWGYNVSPARGNSVRTARMKKEPLEYGLSPGEAEYWSGANLYPDSNYVQAGILQQITYPTGGHTTFEYECNRAFSIVNYNNNSLTSGTLSWALSAFNTAKSISMPGRTQERVRFYLKANEPNPRPAPGTGPVSCIEGMQDEKVVRFQVVSTDNTISVNLDVVYAHMVGGAAVDTDLPVDKVYTVKAVYDASATCAYMYPFSLQAYVSYEVTPYDKLAGGVRVKKVQAFDGAGNRLTKEYFYTDSMGRSSATIAVVPDYRYHRETTSYSNANPSKRIVMSSSPTGTLNFFNGSPVIYKRVIEVESNGAYTERLYDSVYEGRGPTGIYPFIPIQDFPLLSGTLIKERIADAAGVVQVEKLYTYNKVTSLLGDSCRNMVVGLIATGGNFPSKMWVVDGYWLKVCLIEPLTEETRTYSGASYISEKITRAYDNLHYLSSNKIINSTNQELNEGFSYVHSQTGSVYDFMRSKNILGSIRGRTTSITQGNLSLDEERNNYALWNGGVLVDVATREKKLLDNPYFTLENYGAYDDKGNVLQYTGKDGIITSFFWGYNKQYPLAKVVGKSYNELVTLSGINLAVVNNPASESALLTELNKLRAVSGTMVSTYLYKPLVGIKREIDMNGNSTYYEYDLFNRLNLVRDKDNNIIKKFCYNYQGQQTECTETVVFDSGCINCTDKSQKCIANVCETGVKHVASSVRLSANSWQCTFYYTWSDGSSSPSYTEITGFGCLLGGL